MNTTSTINKIRPALILYAGFAITGVSWAVDFSTSPAAPQIQSASTVDEAHAGLPAGLYEYFHDAQLHKPDGLGNYSENYRLAEATDPQIQSTSTVDEVDARLPAGLYAYFHDVRLHKPDGLGNYSENYRLAEAKDP